MASEASPSLRIVSMSSMIVELAKNVSAGDEHIDGFDVPQHTLSSARYKLESNYSQWTVREELSGNLGFPWIHTRELGPDTFPSRERVTLNKPRDSPAVPRAACNVVIFPWVRR